MSDSIERILEDAGKSAMKYWDCDGQKCCFECPSREVHVECTKAQRIDLVKRTRAMFKRQLPEGVEWPRFEDGKLVEIGDDATMPQVVYVACVLCKDTRDMDGDEMQTLMIRDLLRRQRELRGGEAR